MALSRIVYPPIFIIKYKEIIRAAGCASRKDIMEDFKTLPPHGSSPLEEWISIQLFLNKSASYIADELIKLWEKGDLLLSAQKTVIRFCLNNSFVEPLARLLKINLEKGHALSWVGLYQVLLGQNVTFSKELMDAVLTGATQNQQLLELSAYVLKNVSSAEPRWQNIFQEELKEKKQKAHQQKIKWHEELNFLKKEGLQDDIKVTLAQILKKFPNDTEAQKFTKEYAEWEDEKILNRISRKYSRKNQIYSDTQISWPELSKKIKQLSKKLPFESVYELAVGIHQMGLDQDSLELLRTQQKRWGPRENYLEMELLISLKLYAEALERAQKILSNKVENADFILNALYIAAKAYKGLENHKQASEILKSLVQNHSDYRDAAVLLKEWESEL